LPVAFTVSITNRAGVTGCDYKNEMYVPIILERIDKKWPT